MVVFNDSYADNYDALYSDKNYAGECDLIAAAAQKCGVDVSSILDVGCGTGGHSLEWVRRGLVCTGVDISSAMIERARNKSAALPDDVRPTWIVGDAQSFVAPGQYDAATMMFAVLGYMNSNDDVLTALSNIRRHIRPDGLFAFDCWYGPAVLGQRPEDRIRIVDTPSGQTIRAASTIVDSYAHLAHVKFRLWSISGDQYAGYTEETHSMRYFFPQELDLLLRSSGFELKSITSFPDGQAASDESWNVFCVATAR
jgi:SAM-dependent methyltransferase